MYPGVEFNSDNFSKNLPESFFYNAVFLYLVESKLKKNPKSCSKNQNTHTYRTSQTRFISILVKTLRYLHIKIYMLNPLDFEPIKELMAKI